MSETISKLRPDRDLQCYFELPSAVAALSETSATGFTLSGSWRQQFDWAVVEWNRDNVFEHPQLRNLPDSDFSGITLSYQETRLNCIQADSSLYATVDWPYLRIWAGPGDQEQVYYVPLAAHASPVGVSRQAYVIFTLSGTVTPGDRIELAWAENHYNYLLTSEDTLDTAALQLALIINTFSTMMTASATGASITLTILPSASGYAGANGKWLGAYGTVSGKGGTEVWQPAAQQFANGQSPTAWKYSLDFSRLTDRDGLPVQTTNIRKMRWTYAADLQPAAFERSEFSVVISDWTVAGTGATYSVAGPGSRRIEDTSPALVYTGTWSAGTGNYSDGSIHFTTEQSATCTCPFMAERTFDVYLGTRGTYNGSQLAITLDSNNPSLFSLVIPGEDVLIRTKVGTVQPGLHTLTLQHTGAADTYFYLDFIELAVPGEQLPVFVESAKTTLATDWDTYHSIAIAPERTAWLMYKLGFTGRANHYVGALRFYEMYRAGHVYASATIEFGGRADANRITTLSIGSASSGGSTSFDHLHLAGDTTATIAQAFAFTLNSGYTSVWAKANGSTLTIQARAMGTAGNDITVGIVTNYASMTVTASASHLDGGCNGTTGGVLDDPDNCGWRTDLTVQPRLNRACRDWSRSFFKALHGYGIEATAAFSTELQHGDPSVTAGIAQRCPLGDAVIVSTPALQTNFSPTSLAFWQQVYADMAQVMVEAGQAPYLQFGEVQWWYFKDDRSGLPFYDDYTTSQFASQYGRPMLPITSDLADPTKYQDEAQFLPTVIGAFTRAIQRFVRRSQPAARFEVLYPPDTNTYPFIHLANLPRNDWTSATLDAFKTENFGFTLSRKLDLIGESIALPMQLGFPANRSSHLVGVGDPTTPWLKEAAQAAGAGMESVVLFALDQYCLIGYQPHSVAPAPRSFMIP